MPRSLHWARSLLATPAAPAGAAYAQTKGGPTPSAPGAAVYFVGVKDGDTLPTKPTIHFGLRNMGVAPAGLDRENAGHHHLIVDAPDAGARPADPERLQQPAFRRRPDRSRGDASRRASTRCSWSSATRTTSRTTRRSCRSASPSTWSTPRRARRRRPGAPRRPTPASISSTCTNGPASRPATVVRFGLLNMGIAPAGVEKPNTGHHHLLVDTPLPALDRPIPNDFNHLHFGAGQTEARITLNPGRAHAAAPVRRREPRAARSAGDVEADQGDGRRCRRRRRRKRRSGPCGTATTDRR